MGKYKLKALSCYFGGKLRKKEDNEVFDSTNFDKKEFDSIISGGFLEEIKVIKVEKDSEKVNPKQKNTNG